MVYDSMNGLTANGKFRFPGRFPRFGVVFCLLDNFHSGGILRFAQPPRKPEAARRFGARPPSFLR